MEFKCVKKVTLKLRNECKPTHMASHFVFNLNAFKCCSKIPKRITHVYCFAMYTIKLKFRTDVGFEYCVDFYTNVSILIFVMCKKMINQICCFAEISLLPNAPKIIQNASMPSCCPLTN